jgi:hypothetical protein
MEKISSIISSTSQAKVDMSKERPVRAGAPSYGQPVSPATRTFEKEKVEKEKEQTFTPAFDTQKLAKPDVERHTGMIDKITLSFKGNSERTEPGVEQVIDLSDIEGSTNEVPLLEEEAPQSIDVYA